MHLGETENVWQRYIVFVSSQVPLKAKQTRCWPKLSTNLMDLDSAEINLG